ncbi:hypothetical protein HH310_33780 [Actinoplanes sp. TBRC 11911]|uniref:DUF6924 domain-containing protein n=1 Tax=Actinoplanes sp. TBRC 11911 TaxID=2729386 RepID=UPI00145CCF02|nr:hypothetical protein [Actinoplanes sp. TBRC 11911]NMO56137.1 hypothetical protein [Actinoplanes sp. TBRC 11911]
MVTVVVRTDYSDNVAWRRVRAALDNTGPTFVIEGPEWDGATVDEVLEASAPHAVLAVVFIADAQTMSSAEYPLLAVASITPDHDDYEETIWNGRDFRTLPRASHEIHRGLELLTDAFASLASVAHSHPGVVFRGRQFSGRGPAGAKPSA